MSDSDVTVSENEIARVHELYTRCLSSTTSASILTLSMTESSSTDAIDLPFSGKPSQGGHSRNSQCPRYASCSRCLIGFLVMRLTCNDLPSAPIHILDDDSSQCILSLSAVDFGRLYA